MKAVAPSLNLGTLFGIAIALTILFAPAVGRGEALAAVPNHDMQMMEVGHCHSPSSHKTGHHEGPMSCCTATCVGVTAAVDRPAQSFAIRITPASISLAALHRPFLGELATPPPRSV